MKIDRIITRERVGKFLQDRRLWILTGACFLFVVFVADDSNLVRQSKLKSEISDLERQKLYYQHRIDEDSVMMERLKDDRFLEHYAREHYRMKRDGETIYLISD